MRKLNCKFAKYNFHWLETEERGWSRKGLDAEKKSTDLRGYWGLIDIQCTILEPNLPLFWCYNPEKCEHFSDGKAKSCYMYITSIPEEEKTNEG